MIKSNTFLTGVKGINEEPATITNSAVNSQMRKNTEASQKLKPVDPKVKLPTKSDFLIAKHD